MNYPVWEVTATGGGLLIALIAIFHVYIAHFAVGGGLFLVLTEWKSYRDQDQRMTDYVASHTKLFLLVTMVLGALTGVGIWLVISAVNPSATSLLIHTFVFAWGTEWVFFVVEIVSLLVYYYTFHKMGSKAHLTVGWIYAAAAWISLFFISGIISFMLTPGSWPETKSFWSAFFNPSFIPSVVFRTSLALIFAGIYGFITATRIKDPDFRQKMVRYCSLWLAAPFVLLIPSAWWYFRSIPAEAQAMILGRSRDIVPFAQAFLWLSPIVFLGGLIMAARMPKRVQQSIAVALLVLGLAYMGSFEYMRETGRRPYVVYDYMYSTGVLKSQLNQTRSKGVLPSARWTEQHKVTKQNELAAGRRLYSLLCLPCHSLGGPRNDILQFAAGYDMDTLTDLMGRMGSGDKAFMPPFPGTAQEKQALANYLIKNVIK